MFSSSTGIQRVYKFYPVSNIVKQKMAGKSEE